MNTDTLIIGSGIAGAVAALRLATDREREVTVITRTDDPAESASNWAQGGIATLGGAADSPALLEKDILEAGAGLCHLPAVRILSREGPRLLEQILVERLGVRFDRDGGDQPAYGLEGAHSRRRVLHVGDTTGQAITDALLQGLGELPNVTLLAEHTAVDLLTYPHHSTDPRAVYESPRCHGAYVLDRNAREVIAVTAAHTVLASGGLGQIFVNTTNPVGARGDGLAMAHRAGARVINAEYVQFHPTAFYRPGTTLPLISEAVRGEGAVLLTPEGDRFMERYAPQELELATRDVVARAIYAEMLTHQYPHVWLDIASHRSPEYIRSRFPWIHRTCLAHRIDITTEPVPVVPAAHYFCGGVRVDLEGRTTLPGLHAVGEVACTGVHGANRLASTSLLEGLVWGVRAADDIRADASRSAIRDTEVPPWHATEVSHDADPAMVQGDRQTIRNLMWHYVGLNRTAPRMQVAVRELRHLWMSIEDFYRKSRLSDELIGLRNAVLAAVIVTQAALRNPVSRGCHFREDAATAPNFAVSDATHPGTAGSQP